MLATKEHRAYTITESEKRKYLEDGFTIYDDNGNLIEKPVSKTVPRAEYEALEAENKKLKAENKALKAGQTGRKTTKGE